MSTPFVFDGMIASDQIRLSYWQNGHRQALSVSYHSMISRQTGQAFLAAGADDSLFEA